MKIIKKEKNVRSVTLRLDECVMQRVDEIARKNKLYRQKLIEAILEQVVADKSFVLSIGK